MGKDVVGAYLKTYAEPQAHAAIGMPGRYEVAAIIPAFDESDAVLDAFAPLLQTVQKVLLVMVANAPDSLEDSHPAVSRTAALARQLSSRCSAVWHGPGGLSLHGYHNGSAWLLVDCFSDGCRLPSHHGVGLARKIGADIACALHHAGTLTDPWFCSTDADVLPPPDLLEFARDNQASALTFPFRHQWEGDAATQTAARLYDFYLHYHVWGLTTAGSPYAHYSIGSTLALNVKRYTQVRGFPRRAAGEDFHLLSKLAKLAPVRKLNHPELVIRARISGRVPFGTGPAISAISKLTDPVNQYSFTNPDCFATLGATLSAITPLYRDTAMTLAQSLRDHLPDDEATLASTILEGFGADEALARARRQASNERRFSHHWHTWFDALKTQQFLHALKAVKRNDLNFHELLQHPMVPRLRLPAHASIEELLDQAREAMLRETCKQPGDKHRQALS